MLQPDRYWKDFCIALGRKELIDDARFADMRTRGKNGPALIKIMDEVFATRDRQEWMKILKEGGDFIYTVGNTVSDLPNDPQVLANEYIVEHEIPGLGVTQVLGMPVKLSETPGNPRGHAPEFGEQTEMLLTEMLGYTWDDMCAPADANVI